MNQNYLDKAAANTPNLYEYEVTTDQTVEMIKDNSFFGVGARSNGTIPAVCQNKDSFILDFGKHCVGYVSFSLHHVDSYLDAPVRLKLKFGEIPYEMSRDYADTKGSLCKSWYQEEILNIDEPGVVRLPRRYSFRYMEVTVIATPRRVHLSDFSVRCVTSADLCNFKPLPKGTDPELVTIDRIAAKTLQDCMQTAYEDGPKRDRRLWSGDLRLQALTDYYLFCNDKLVRRCLYLFAACEQEGKYLPACLYQKPTVYYDEGNGITDYSFAWINTLCDYYAHTDDKETTIDLFPVAKRLIELAISLHDENGVITFLDGWSSFIDWAAGLHTTTAVEGAFLYTLENLIMLAKALGEYTLAVKWENILTTTRKSAYTALFDAGKNAFINAYDHNQYAVQAQVWMILGDVISGEQGYDVLKQSLKNAAIQPVTPYMHHYVVEALIKLGRMEEALRYIKSYWGGMVKENADTFWEVYLPQDRNVSPYGDPISHSFCHAWSCSPSYFIRKYFVEE